MYINNPPKPCSCKRTWFQNIVNRLVNPDDACACCWLWDMTWVSLQVRMYMAHILWLGLCYRQQGHTDDRTGSKRNRCERASPGISQPVLLLEHHGLSSCGQRLVYILVMCVWRVCVQDFFACVFTRRQGIGDLKLVGTSVYSLIQRTLVESVQILTRDSGYKA